MFFTGEDTSKTLDLRSSRRFKMLLVEAADEHDRIVEELHERNRILLSELSAANLSKKVQADEMSQGDVTTLQEHTPARRRETLASLHGDTEPAPPESLPMCEQLDVQMTRRVSTKAVKLALKVVDELESHEIEKTRRRFLTVLNGGTYYSNTLVVDAETLQAALHCRCSENFPIEEVVLFILDFNHLRNVLLPERCNSQMDLDLPNTVVPFEAFVLLMTIPALPDYATTPEEKNRIETVCKLLVQCDAKEIIAHATHRSGMDHIHSRTSGGEFTRQHRLKRQVMLGNMFMSGLIALNLFCLAINLDGDSDWRGWVVFDATFMIIFLAEIAIKFACYGLHGYFTGSDGGWNALDIIVTMGTITEFIFGFILTDSKDYQVTIALRCLRGVRIARLLRYSRMGWLMDLAKMLEGLLICLPCLIGVLLLLLTVTFLLALSIRQVVNNASGSVGIDTCGRLEELDTLNPECKGYLAISEEYFSTMPAAMFTLFRCMIGDCSTRGGMAMVPWLAEGYGLQFYLTYTAGMTIVIFALFNVITALFVDATMQGLLDVEHERRYAQLYNTEHVGCKLEAMLKKIGEIRNDEFTELTVQEFDVIMCDPEILDMMANLDISLSPDIKLFEMFDTDGNGRITLGEFVDTLLRVRGEPAKSDIVSVGQTVRRLRDLVREFEYVAVSNQRTIEFRLDEILTKMQGTGGLSRNTCQAIALAEGAPPPIADPSVCDVLLCL
eukprot:NODE_1634_length_2414_cov_12.505028.p1 GENE.NODE_1634_length_2414_cov_12.505028~~NODE_1634_length_2414_cov_12.505028.p1  ORF type:complete len:726 (+),score=136.29 NODE_1634_length_2414_cov_12.505028:58-2235(+)